MTSAPSPHLVRSAISAALFFLPLGIIAVVYSLTCQQALDDSAAGDQDLDQVALHLDRARRASRLAYRWSTAAIVVGIGLYVVLLTAFLLLGAFG